MIILHFVKVVTVITIIMFDLEIYRIPFHAYLLGIIVFEHS